MGDLRRRLAARVKAGPDPVPAGFDWGRTIPEKTGNAQQRAEWGRLSSFFTIAIVIVLAIVLAYRLSPVASHLSSVVHSE